MESSEGFLVKGEKIIMGEVVKMLRNNMEGLPSQQVIDFSMNEAAQGSRLGLVTQGRALFYAFHKNPSSPGL